MQYYSLPISDLIQIDHALHALSARLSGAHILITGINGFFGLWMAEAFLYLNEKHNLELRILGLTRSSTEFYKRYPHLSHHESLDIAEGSVLAIPQGIAPLDFIIHAANLPVQNSDTWTEDHISHALWGTQNILHLAEEHRVRSLLICSSGAVYSVPNANRVPYEEGDFLSNSAVGALYAHAKRMIEYMVSSFQKRTTLPTTICRCFSFIGPHLPLKNFALGQFINNVRNGESIRISGTGLARRSYMYGSDLVTWLISMMTQAIELHVYNVGSDESISLKELATQLGTQHQLPVEILGASDTGLAPSHYIPSIQRAKDKLNLQLEVSLADAIERTLQWNINQT